MRIKPSILDRYVVREVLGPLGLGLLVFTFLLLIDALFDLAAIIIHREVPPLLVAKLLALNLPHIVVLTIPMSLLFGILIAVGRLSADSELVAIRASGVSLWALYRPILLVSLVLAAVNLAFTTYALPRGNAALQDLAAKTFAQSATREVKPRVFYEELEGRVLYVFRQPRDSDVWEGLFLADSLPGRRHRVTMARSGRIEVDETGRNIVLHLSDTTDHEIDLDHPDRYNIRHHASLDLVLEDKLLAAQQERQRTKAVRELGIAELIVWRSDPTRSDLERRLAAVELHKKFAIPAICLVFGLFGVPLGFNNRRGGRSSGFAISIAVIMTFYILLSNGERLAAQGKLDPAVAMWLPNAVFLLLGLFLLARRNRDKSLLLTRLDRWVREHLWARLRAHQRLRQRRQYRRRRGREEASLRRLEERMPHRPESTGIVLRLQRPRLPFPNTMDRYILTLFCRVLVLVTMAGSAAYIIANFTELVDEMLKNEVPSAVILDYYKYLSLQIFHQIAPFVILLTTLIVFGLLSRSNEVIASRALGISLYRLAIPVLVASAVVATADAALASSILPHSNGRVAELKDRIRGTERVRTYRSADQQWLFGSSDTIYNYQYFERRRQVLQRLHAFRIDPERLAIAGVLYAEELRYAGDEGWIVFGGWARTFARDGTQTFRKLRDGQRIDLPEEPAFFESEVKQPDLMGIAELRAHVRALRASGQDVPELEVQLHNKIAMPAAVLVMAIVALPFAFRLGRHGALYGIGIALALGIGFYACIAAFTTLGEAGALPAPVAAWGPSLLFATGSMYLFLGVRT